MKTTILAAAVLAAAACTIEPDPWANDPTPDFVVDGAKVYIASAPTDTWAHGSDLPERLHAVFARAAEFWGGSIDDLRDAKITLGGWDACGSGSDAYGSEYPETNGDAHRAVIDLVVYVSQIASHATCVESSVLLHELGHAMLPPGPGNYEHTDPKWSEYRAVNVELAALHPDCTP